MADQLQAKLIGDEGEVYTMKAIEALEAYHEKPVNTISSKENLLEILAENSAIQMTPMGSNSSR